VQQLWGNNASLTSDPPASSANASSQASSAPPARPAGGGRLDLFSDPNGTFSG
jgi:hypothetical protein